MKITLIILTFAVVLLCSRPAAACSCFGTSAVCGSFAAAEAVFVGSVMRVENETIKDDNGAEFITGQNAYIQVEEAFKGTKATELVFRSYGTSCDPTYKEGQRWLFYARYNKEDKAWSIAACDRSTLVEGAADDLLYLRGLPRSAQQTRLAGKLRTQDNKPLMGVKVKLIGEGKTYEVTTDTNGVYEKYGLPPGKYAVEPEIPLNLKLGFASASGPADYTVRNRPRVELKEKSCAGLNFSFNENTLITGRVFGADGQLMRNVCVRLRLKDKPAETPFLLDCTEADGRFTINDIGLGEYHLVVNDDGVISSNEPFPTTYYPGVLEKEKATVLTFASGDQLLDFDIHIPSQRPTRTIQGRLLFSDGRPVEGESVQFTSETKDPKQTPDEVHTKTDAEGRFKLSVLEGSKGTLHGYLYSFSREAAKCPQVDKLVKAYKDIETSRVKVEMNRDHENIELVFPFPYCAKAKEQE